MKKFVFLTYGFEEPTPKIMEDWGRWLESIKDNIVEMGHFPRGREISERGIEDLPLGPDSITGYVIVTADDFDHAGKMAQSNPFISSIRLYEVMSGGAPDA